MKTYAIKGNPVELEEWDEIVITAEWKGRTLTDFRCMVSTTSGDAIKVWPMNDKEPQLTEQERYDGKLWFPVEKIESVKVLIRWSQDPPMRPANM